MGLFGPKQNPKAIGERSQAYIIARLLESGYNVLIPYGDNLRYDVVIEDADGAFWRVQCKTGWIEHEGAYIEFKSSSSYIIQEQEERVMEEETIEDRLIILPSIALIQGRYILFL